MNILVIGGAGFVGSHLVDALLERGHRVSVLDNLDPQVHGPERVLPTYCNAKADYIVADVLDSAELKAALKGIDAVYYLAAAVGVGQSMYEVRRYVEVNSLGGAVFLDLLANSRHGVQKVIVASSMSIYGEGCYRTAAGELKYPKLRSKAQLTSKHWEHLSENGERLLPIGTPEDKPLNPTSVYAVTKRDHEELFLAIGAGYGIPVAALRLFNIFGTRQSLSNPYTGVAAIFSSMILNGTAPQIFEDGEQTRDFVHVSDVVQAMLLALEKAEADGEVFNVGSGRAITISQIAAAISREMEYTEPALITQKFRVGDIRHCFADITKAQTLLGYNPQVTIESGMSELCAWVRSQTAENRVTNSNAELNSKNLLW